jgi:hypothetical protein
MHKGALPALIVVAAGGYWLYKSRPSSAFAASLTKALAKVQDSIAQPQRGPQIIDPKVITRLWSDKSTTFNLLPPSAVSDSVPQVSGTGLLRDSQALRDVLQAPSAIPAYGGNVS